MFAVDDIHDTVARLRAHGAELLAEVAQYENIFLLCYLRGPAGDTRCDEHVRLVNTANRLHAVDPETYFRTARTFFSFNEKKFSDAVDASAG